MLAVAFIAVNVAVRWANVHYHLGLAESAADRMRDAGRSHRASRVRRDVPRTSAARRRLGEFRRTSSRSRSLGGVEIANNSHDIFIDLLAKSGLVGCVLVVALVTWFVRAVRAPQSSARVRLRADRHPADDALVEYPQQYMFFLLPAMFVIGLLEVKSLRILPGRAAFGLFAVLSVGGVLAAVPVLRDYQRAEVLYYGSDPAAQYRDAPSLLFGAG